MKTRVLMIDDDQFLLNMYKRKFELNGMDVQLLMHTGGDVMQKIIDAKPDLISLGIIMPERNGFQIAKMLVEDDRTRDIPIIFLTNQGQTADIEAAIKFNPLGYIIMATTTPQEVTEEFLRLIEKHSNQKNKTVKNKHSIKNTELEKVSANLESTKVTNEDKRIISDVVVNKVEAVAKNESTFLSFIGFLIKIAAYFLVLLLCILLIWLAFWIIISIGPLWIIAIVSVMILFTLIQRYK